MADSGVFTHPQNHDLVRVPSKNIHLEDMWAEQFLYVLTDLGLKIREIEAN